MFENDGRVFLEQTDDPIVVAAGVDRHVYSQAQENTEIDWHVTDELVREVDDLEHPDNLNWSNGSIPLSVTPEGLVAGLKIAILSNTEQPHGSRPLTAEQKVVAVEYVKQLKGVLGLKGVDEATWRASQAARELG
jgi:hypothetical protein